MKKTLLLLAALPLFTACYTTNDVFVPAPETSYKMSHELMLTTTLPLITIPQNVGFSYRLATPGIAGSQFSLNYFLRYERGLRRIQVEAEEIDGNRRIKSDNVKTVLMPTFQLGEDVQLGLGFGGNYVFGIDDGYKTASGMFLPVFNVNLNYVTNREAGRLNYWNFAFTYCDRTNKTAGVNYRTFTPYSDSSYVYHLYDDLGSALICKSLKFTFTSEREMKGNPAIKAILRFDFGFSYIGDEGIANYPGFNYENSGYEEYKGFNLPLGFSVGLKF